MLEAPSWPSAATGAVAKSARGVRRACTLASKRCEDACDSGPRGQSVPKSGRFRLDWRKGSQVTLTQRSGFGSVRDAWLRSQRTERVSLQQGANFRTPGAQWPDVVSQSLGTTCPAQEEPRTHQSATNWQRKPRLTAAVILCSGAEGQGRRWWLASKPSIVN